MTEARRPASVSLPAPRTVLGVLMAGVVLLTLLSLAGQFYKYTVGGELNGLIPLFYSDVEPSIPTWYSASLLLVAGGLFGVVAAVERGRGHPAGGWWLMTAVLLLMSSDEIGMMHELPIERIQEEFGFTGLLYFGWMIPGAILVAILGVILIPFLRRLPARTRWMFLLSGAVYLSGAIVLEMVSGIPASERGKENLTYAVITSIEEFCEMAGAALLIYALVDHKVRAYGRVSLILGGDGGGVVAPTDQPQPSSSSLSSSIPK